jgi:hypothetical protein
MFKNPPFFTRTHLSLPSSNGIELIAHAGDYLKVQIIADLDYKVDTGGE